MTAKAPRPHDLVEPDISSEDLFAGLKKIAEIAEKADLSKATSGRELTAAGERIITPSLRDADDEHQAAILAKVAKFLDVKSAGPVYTIPVRGKVFVGTFITATDALQVERMAAVPVGTELTSGQWLTMVVGELLKSVKGWVPEGSPRAQLLIAHLDHPSDWPKLEEVNWMAERDPYVRTEEIEPLWDAYQTWKKEVTPSSEEIRFYYSRMT